MCDEIEDSRHIPSNWREHLLNCRNCKLNLVLYLSKYYLKTMSKSIMPGKSLILAGCFKDPINTTAWCIIRDGIPQPNPLLTCNAEETDTRLWLHCKQSTSDNILILSPDTDIYHIGLPLNHGTKYIMIRINTYNSKDLCFLHLSSLINALNRDPDLSSVESSLLPRIHQTLFVVTGCDYISFFRGIGKATFMRYFFQHSEFITSGKGNTMGTLAKVSVQNKEYEEGFISFLRLVGVVYMKKHISGFNRKTPEAYFNEFYKQGQSISKQHLQWLDDIRQCIWDCIQFENEMIPSVESLFRHWKRACWVLDLWKQSDKNIMCPKPLSEYG